MSIFGIPMNITDLSIARARKVDKSRQSHKSVSTVAPVTGQVDISNAAFSFQDAEAIALSAPDIDATLISEMKAAIANGELEIDYERLAQKMLALESELNDVLPPHPNTD